MRPQRQETTKANLDQPIGITKKINQFKILKEVKDLTPLVLVTKSSSSINSQLDQPGSNQPPPLGQISNLRPTTRAVFSNWLKMRTPALKKVMDSHQETAQWTQTMVLKLTHYLQAAWWAINKDTRAQAELNNSKTNRTLWDISLKVVVILKASTISHSSKLWPRLIWSTSLRTIRNHWAPLTRWIHRRVNQPRFSHSPLSI